MKKRAVTFSLKRDGSGKTDDPENEQIKPFIIPLFDIPPRASFCKLFAREPVSPATVK